MTTKTATEEDCHRRFCVNANTTEALAARVERLEKICEFLLAKASGAEWVVTKVKSEGDASPAPSVFHNYQFRDAPYMPPPPNMPFDVPDAAPSTVTVMLDDLLILMNLWDDDIHNLRQMDREAINRLSAALGKHQHSSLDAAPRAVNLGAVAPIPAGDAFYMTGTLQDYGSPPFNVIKGANAPLTEEDGSTIPLRPSQPDAAPQETDPLMMAVPRELMEQVLIDLTRMTNFVSDEDAVRAVIRHVEYFMSLDASPATVSQDDMVTVRRDDLARVISGYCWNSPENLKNLEDAYSRLRAAVEKK